MDRRGSLLNQYLQPDDQVFTMQEADEGERESFIDGDDSLRTNSATESMLSAEESRDRQRCDIGCDELKARRTRCWRRFSA
eukprot:COSAG01_NODE_58891_length_303_cov_0.955882_1_plen_80_part_01